MIRFMKDGTQSTAFLISYNFMEITKYLNQQIIVDISNTWIRYSMFVREDICSGLRVKKKIKMEFSIKGEGQGKLWDMTEGCRPQDNRLYTIATLRHGNFISTYLLRSLG